MLRVITEQHGDGYRLDLHGKIAGEWVSLLEQYWRSISNQSPDITVVVSEVDFIDADGERLLHQMADAGVKLLASGCMNRAVIERIQCNGQAMNEDGRQRARGCRRIRRSR